MRDHGQGLCCYLLGKWESLLLVLIEEWGSTATKKGV